MTARPPPSQPQGSIPLYAAIAPNMGTDEMKRLAQAPVFDGGAAGFYLTQFDLVRMDLDAVRAAVDWLEYDDVTGTFPLVLHFDGPDTDHCAGAVTAILSAVRALHPDALMVMPPPDHVDPNRRFLRDLQAKLAAHTGPTPYLYRGCGRPFGYVLPHDDHAQPSRMLMQCLSRAGIQDNRRWAFRSWVDALINDPHAHQTVIDGMVVPLDGTDDDAEFLRHCRQHLDEAQKLKR